MKKRSSTWYRKKCVGQAKQKVKEKAGYKCERCGRSKANGYVMHGSHVFPEGTYKSMSAEEDNIICLCYLCHFMFWHKSPHEASRWFDEKWPGRYKKLQKQAQEIKIINWELKYKSWKT